MDVNDCEELNQQLVIAETQKIEAEIEKLKAEMQLMKVKSICQPIILLSAVILCGTFIWGLLK